VVVGFDGFVAKYMGDGVLVYSATRKRIRTMLAVRAGLDAIETVSRPVKGVKVRARVGSPLGWWSSVI
jgi:hypothetical protein